MNVLNILTQKTEKIGNKNIIKKNIKTKDFILSIPHSGLLIPLKYKNHFNLNAKSLIEIDLFSDLVFENEKGTHLISKFVPFFVDMNRKKGGSTDAPHHLQNDPLHYFNIKDKPMLIKQYTKREKKKIIKYYNRYNNSLKKLIKQMKKRKGYALLIDGHSMTSVGLGRSPGTGEKRADFVIGTLNGNSADPRIIKTFSKTLKKEAKSQGLTFKENIPYSGGFITKQHSDPKNNVHVIQLEVVMKNYMYECTSKTNKKYNLKKQKLKQIQKIIQKTIDATYKTAEKIYS